MKTRIYIVAVALALGACANPYKPQHTINEIVIVNNTRDVIGDVSIRSTTSGRVFACGNIAPLGICSDRFPTRRLSDGPVVIEWSLGGKRGQETLPAEVPLTLSTGLVLRGVLEFNPDGSIEGRFEQESRFRG